MARKDASSPNEPRESIATETAKLLGQIEKWREKLLDLGNRNALIHCSFNLTRGALEFAHPDAESVWRKLAAEAEAGVAPMRFPWRRELVPPPIGAGENIAEPADSAAVTVKPGALAGTAKRPFQPKASGDTSGERFRAPEWNPSLDECLASKKLGDSDLLTDATDKALDRRLRTFNSYAHLSMSEQGVHCLYVAFGFLKWFESIDSDKELWSPLMLVPVTLSQASADAAWELTEAEDDAIDNLCLRQRLKQDFNLELPALPGIDRLEEPGERLKFLEAIRKAVEPNDRWEVVDRCVLGRFAFPKIAMWKDLGDHSPSIIANALCQAIAGSSTVAPQIAFGTGAALPEGSKLDDEIPPGEIKAIRDCDSSQLEAIVAARRGVSFVLDGPPGTGKSQTIANIIADALANGRRILFVSEKIAALEVVKKRLDECGLGDFCLECHSSKANRKAVLDELSWCLELPAETYSDATPKLEDTKRQRDALNAYVRSVHRPHDPLQVSPYEIYGHVARLNRAGLANRSRCLLPDPATVNRETFNAWLRVLEEATEVADVISRHGSHPWRGCKVTSRSLGLDDDLLHHLAELSNAFATIDRATQWMRDDGLLANSLTPARIGETQAALRESLTAPSVPPSWFAEPNAIADSVFARLSAQNTIETNRSKLQDYAADVAEQFSPECIERLFDREAGIWNSQLRKRPPESVRSQTRFYAKLAESLRRLEAAAQRTADATAELLKAFCLSLAAELPTSKVPKLAELARIVAANLPFRPLWFDLGQSGRLRRLAQDSLRRLDVLADCEARLTPRIPAERIELVAQIANESPQVESAWELIQPLQPEGEIADLPGFCRQAQAAANAMRAAAAGGRELASALNLDLGFQPSRRYIEAVLPVIEPLVRAEAFHGAWVATEIRTRIQNACDAAIADLEEAAALKAKLQDRMSHRAFKSSAAEIANRSRNFRSWWKRTFGGFAAFRADMADLYTADVPSTKQLLADCQQLIVFHRRIHAASSSAAELADYLPGTFDAEDSVAWQRLRQSLASFTTLLSVDAAIGGVLPPKSFRVDRFAVEAAVRRTTQALSRLDQAIAATPFAEIVPGNATLDECAERLSEIAESAFVCQRVWEQVAPCYSTQPDRLPLMFADMHTAVEHRRNHAELMAEALREQEHLPHAGVPSERSCWERLQAGVDAAEKLAGTIRVSDAMREATCTEGCIDEAALSAASDNAQSRYSELKAALLDLQDVMVVSFPAESSTDPERQPAGKLVAIAKAAAEQFESRTQCLVEVQDWLRPGADVPVDRLAADSTAIEEWADALNELADTDERLQSLDAESPAELPDGGRVAAMWLRDQSQRGPISPLIQAVASDNQARQLAQGTLAEMKQVMPSLKKSWEFLITVIDPWADAGPAGAIANSPVGDLAPYLRGLSGQISALDEWLKFARWRSEMNELGLGTVVEELLEGKYEPGQATDCVAGRFYRNLYDYLASRDRLLGEFDFEKHEKVRERFRQLDAWEVKAAATRIRQYQLGRDDRPRLGWAAPSTSELGILQREMQKKRRQKPLRALFSEIPGVLQRLKPCIMMSPLSVSTFLQSDELRFDLVIFDEASQVFPWDAMGAIYRGTQLIVAGDEKQLPPTNFFNRGDIESEDDDDDIGDFESILSVCKSIGMPNQRLRWHYRSRREPLIAFSNRKFYAGELNTFPSIRDASGDSVRLELVPDGRWIDRKNLPEAERIADLVIEHLRQRPDTSLGVIAFNINQQHAIEDVLFDRRRRDSRIDALFTQMAAEPMFVKNLESVQGDARDVIFLSLGYAFNEAGRFVKNFGPLSKSGGERRLNVAITRACEEMVFVSSVRAADMDLSGSLSEGSHLLKAFLEYAERGVAVLGDGAVAVGAECESPFEEEVAAALIREGLNPVAQVGCGGYRIDLALKHSQRPGEFCLGIECDGASYHSSKTARDRDRIRQDVLENLGWTIVRIWSTDWVRNPARQVKRVIEAYDRAVAAAPASSPARKPIAVTGDDLEDDLQPRLVRQRITASPSFSKIEEVSDDRILTAAKAVLIRVGATELSDFHKLVSRELGFARTGAKIRSRLVEVVEKGIRAGNFRMIGERLTLN